MINEQRSPDTYSVTPVTTSNNTWKIIGIVVIGIIAIGGIVYVMSQEMFKLKDTSTISHEVSNQPVIETTVTHTEERLPKQSTPEAQSQKQNPEITFANKLFTCTKSAMTLEHPFTGEMVRKEILGIVNGKCNYREQMPNGRNMECKYSQSERITIAQYYTNVAMAESFSTNSNIHSGSGGYKTIYTINGKGVGNPLQEAIDGGICVISGY